MSTRAAYCVRGWMATTDSAGRLVVARFLRSRLEVGVVNGAVGKWGGEMIPFSEGGGTTVTTNSILVKYPVIP